jgi:hypothetical protein
MKVVINSCFGGFGLSYKAVMLYSKLKGIDMHAFMNEETPHGYNYDKYVEYVPTKGKRRPFIIYYSTGPLVEGKYQEDKYFGVRDIPRDDEDLIKVVEKLGKKANGDCAELKIIEIPDDIDWEITEYDGNESIEEVHRSWS